MYILKQICDLSELQYFYQNIAVYNKLGFFFIFPMLYR